MSAAITRLYAEFLEHSDRAARSMDIDRRHVARLETEICTQLANQPGGIIVIGQMEFRVFEVQMGKAERIQYFRVTIYQERRADAGFSFARRRTDGPDPVLPVSALRRRKTSLGQ
jgi:hypothetical protein